MFQRLDFIFACERFFSNSRFLFSGFSVLRSRAIAFLLHRCGLISAQSRLWRRRTPFRFWRLSLSPMLRVLFLFIFYVFFLVMILKMLSGCCLQLFFRQQASFDFVVRQKGSSFPWKWPPKFRVTSLLFLVKITAI